MLQHAHRPLADLLYAIATPGPEFEHPQREGNQAVADQLWATQTAAQAPDARVDSPCADTPWWAAELDAAVADCATQPLTASEAAEANLALDLARPWLGDADVAAVEQATHSPVPTFGGAVVPHRDLLGEDADTPRDGKTHHIEFRAYIPDTLGAPLSEVLTPTGLDNQAEFDAEVAAMPGAWLAEPDSFGNPVTGTTVHYCGTDPRGPGGPGEYSRMRTQLDLRPTDLDGSSTPVAGTSCGVSDRAWADVDGLTHPVGRLYHDTKRAESAQTFHWTPGGSGVLGALQAHGCYPFISDWVAPAIDYRVVFERRGNQLICSGWHNGFPAYDLLFDGKVIYQLPPEDAGPGIWNLGFQRIPFTAEPAYL